MTDSVDSDKPQDIVCAGGIVLNFGQLFGLKPPKDDDGE